MTGPAFLADEEGRLRALASYNVVGTPPEKDYDHIARLAADLFDAPIALVSLVDRETQWFKARIGLEASQTDRNVSFCAHAIVGDDVLVVPDASHDGRFADNPLVTGS